MKEILKSIKMHESTISTFFGFIVIVIVGLSVINYFRNIDTAGETFPTGANTESTPNLAEGYEVQDGDTLWSIAQTQLGDGFQWEEIAKANDINNPDDIEVGQSLIIPEGDKIAMEDSQTEISQDVEVSEPSNNEVLAQDNHETTNAPKDESYTVQHGDNLWEIAVKEYGDGYRWVDIAQANNLANPSIIHSGNVFVIPS